MKGQGNDGTGDIPERDEWQTKQDLWNKLDMQYNFKFDCCANNTNTKTQLFTGTFESVSKVEGTAWMNPPFSKAYAMFKHFFSVVEKGVAIYRCDNMETKVWQDIILPNASWIFIPKGRISYVAFEVGDMGQGNGTRFPSALIGIGVNPPLWIEGCLLKPTDTKLTVYQLKDSIKQAQQ